MNDPKSKSVDVVREYLSFARILEAVIVDTALQVMRSAHHALLSRLWSVFYLEFDLINLDCA